MNKYPTQTLILDGIEVTFSWLKGVNFSDFQPITQSYGITINKDGQILIARKDAEHRWILPGGSVEAGETTLETLKREFLEEVDIEVIEARELGLQKVETALRTPGYQARYIVTDYIIHPKTPDPDSGYIWETLFVKPEEVNSYLKWGKAADAMFEDAIKFVKS